MRIAAEGEPLDAHGKRAASASQAAWLRSPAASRPATRFAGAPAAALAPAVRGALLPLATADGCSAEALAPGLGCAHAPARSLALGELLCPIAQAQRCPRALQPPMSGDAQRWAMPPGGWGHPWAPTD